MMLPGLTLATISPEVGIGIITTRPIARGTITWVRDSLDLQFSEEELRALPVAVRKEIEALAFRTVAGDYLYCWDSGRYMNHSCEPTGREIGGILQVAARDIAAGEELTCEYGMLNLTGTLRCLCGRSRCRGLIGPDDIVQHWQDWDAEIRSAIAAAPAEQPLAELISRWPAASDLLARIRAGHGEIPSCLEFRCPQGASGQPQLTAGSLWRLPG